MEYDNFTFEKFEKAFKSVKHNKADRHDDIDSNVNIATERDHAILNLTDDIRTSFEKGQCTL